MLKTNLSSGEWRVAVDEVVSATMRDRQNLDDPTQLTAAPAPPTAPSAEPDLRSELESREREEAEATLLLPSALADHLKSLDSAPETPATPSDETPPPPAVASLEEMPDPDLSVIGEIRAGLLTEITEHEGIFLLTAEIGIDRASLLGGLARELRAAGHFVSIVPGDGLTVRDLLLDLSLKAGIQPPALDGLEPWLGRFHTAARAAYIRRSLIVVLIDDAEQLADDLIGQFAALLFQAPGKPSSLRLLLTGHVPVERLADPQFLTTRQAIVSHRHLRRFPNGTIGTEILPLATVPSAGKAAGKTRRTLRILIGGVAAAIVAAVWLLPEILASDPAPVAVPAGKSAVAPLVIQLPSRTQDVLVIPMRSDAQPPAATNAAPNPPAADTASTTPAAASVNPPAPPGQPATEAAQDKVEAAAVANLPGRSDDPPPPPAPAQPAAEASAVTPPSATERSTTSLTADATAATEPVPANAAASATPTIDTVLPSTATTDAEPAVAAAEVAPPPAEAKPAADAAPAPAVADAAPPVVVAAATPAPVEAKPVAETAAAPTVVDTTPPVAAATVIAAPPADVARPEATTVAAAVTPPPAAEAAARTPTPAAPPAEPKRETPAVQPPSDAAAALIRRGDEFLAIKDIAAARLFYERAAGAGSAPAATMAGKTYDPRYLQEIGARGLSPNPGKAAEWYKKAADLGDAEAATRLRALPASR